MRDFDDQVWQIICALDEYEQNFNQLQHQYRTMASGWVLAVFAGLQFVMDGANQETLISRPWALVFLGLAGAIGLTLLWNLDLRVYHQLLESCFVEGLELERVHSWLPRIRTNMLKTQDSKEKGVLDRVVWFYIVGILVMLCISSAGLIKVSLDHPDCTRWALALSLLASICTMLLWSHLIQKGTRSPLLENWVRRNLTRTEC